MGILNLTPDSFSDGGLFLSPNQAIEHAEQMIEEGVDYLDLGGESTRPNAKPVSETEELKRIMPVLEILRTKYPDLNISVDTYKPNVMKAVLQAGANMINDVRALQMPNALEIVAESNVEICLMHAQGTPQTMQVFPTYQNVVSEVKSFLKERISICEQWNIERKRLYIDVGFGFGKTLQHNLILMKHLKSFEELGCKMLVGVSRKSMIGLVLNEPVEKRLYGGLSLAVFSALQGAAMIRTHDVLATRQALQMLEAVLSVEET
ncbi:MAG: 7,8-dihydropteroate synthase [Pseudomonadota bacterium]